MVVVESQGAITPDLPRGQCYSCCYRDVTELGPSVHCGASHVADTALTAFTLFWNWGTYHCCFDSWIQVITRKRRFHLYDDQHIYLHRKLENSLGNRCGQI